MRRVLIGMMLVAGGTGCASANPTSERLSSGELTARWTGFPTRDSAAADSAAFAAAATASWCPTDSLLEVLAVRNDTAVGLSIVAQDSIRPGPYSVFQAKIFTPIRPQATAAVRIFDGQTLQNYESTSGQLTVTEGGSVRVSGTFDLRVHVLVGNDSLQVTGRFSRLAIRPAIGRCGRVNKP
jgi:hypothetical protein